MENKEKESQYNQSLKQDNSEIDKNDNVFTEDNNKCFGNNQKQADVIIEDCDVLHRLICALKYHSTLNSQQFNEFCNNVYQNPLNDYIHFMTIHSS
eukprot:247944_1